MVDFRGLRFHDRAPVYQQIAEQEGVSIQAVRDSILSALKKLRLLL